MNWPAPRAVLELLKPITWFAPMWAFVCGVISCGAEVRGKWPVIAAGLLLAGPFVCGTSQAVNDWYDRDVDKINEPARPIPSGRIPEGWGFNIALGWTAISCIVAIGLGFWGFSAAVLGLVLAWAYSAPPLRLKRNGWWGNSAVAACYEGLPWATGAAVTASTLPDWRILILALLYSAGAHGIMTLNDFKSVEGDRRTGIGSLPVRLGPARAARVACLTMAAPQSVTVALLVFWRQPIPAGIVAALLVGQLLLMRRLLRSPCELAPWYNATGTTLYVFGMLASAFAVRALLGTTAA